MNKPSQKNALGCSVTSLLLLISVSAIMLALITVFMRWYEGTRRTPREGFENIFVFAMFLMPLCGALVGHMRFHRLRYIVCGAVLGLLVGILLLWLAVLPPASLPSLIIVTTMGAGGLIAFRLFLSRGPKKPGGSPFAR